MILEAYFKHKLSQCELIEGNLPELIVSTKYLHSSINPWGVIDFPRTFLGLILQFIKFFNSPIRRTNYGLNLFSESVAKLCKSLSF